MYDLPACIFDGYARQCPQARLNAIVNVVPSDDSFVYFAFVTIRPYGDITPVKAWQLLGPAAAMNGLLLFGWSMAVIFEGITESNDARARSAIKGPADRSAHAILACRLGDVEGSDIEPRG
jgi:hypothetical protein